MNESMGGACKADKQGSRAEILNHAFHLPENIVYKLESLRKSLSCGETSLDPSEKMKEVDYSSLESILNDGAGLINEASGCIVYNIERINSILFDMHSCDSPSASGMLKEKASSAETKLDVINEAYGNFELCVIKLRTLEDTVLKEGASGVSKIHPPNVSTDNKIETTVHYVLHELPEKIIQLHSEACSHIEQISTALLT